MTSHPLAFAVLVRAVAVAGVCAFGSVSAATPDTAARAGKTAAAKPSAPKASRGKSTSSRAARNAPAKPVEAPLADATPEQIEAAEKVFYGTYDCEFQQSLDIEKDPKHPAYVNVKAGKSGWTMRPVLSSTGAIRLEDVKGETLMVQIASKSMLLNVKSARRIVDDCVSSRQRELMEEARLARAAAEAAGTGGAAPAAPLLQAPGAALPAAAASSAPAAPASAASTPN